MENVGCRGRIWRWAATTSTVVWTRTRYHPRRWEDVLKRCCFLAEYTLVDGLMHLFELNWRCMLESCYCVSAAALFVVLYPCSFIFLLVNATNTIQSLLLCLPFRAPVLAHSVCIKSVFTSKVLDVKEQWVVVHYLFLVWQIMVPQFQIPIEGDGSHLPFHLRQSFTSSVCCNIRLVSMPVTTRVVLGKSRSWDSTDGAFKLCSASLLQCTRIKFA